MRRWLNPRRLRDNLRKIGAVRRGGGPKRIRVVHVSPPRGVIAPTSDIELEVEAKDGTVTDVQTFIPIPWPYVWAWRIGRKLNLPVVRSLDPEHLDNLALNLPRRG
jgi:hypothetical protein